MPDPRWGEQVGAVILLAAPDAPPAPVELHAHCRAGLAAFKTPKLWFFVEELPLTPSGKVRTFLVRERIAAGQLGRAVWAGG